MSNVMPIGTNIAVYSKALLANVPLSIGLNQMEIVRNPPAHASAKIGSKTIA